MITFLAFGAAFGLPMPALPRQHQRHVQDIPYWIGVHWRWVQFETPMKHEVKRHANLVAYEARMAGEVFWGLVLMDSRGWQARVAPTQGTLGIGNGIDLIGVAQAAVILFDSDLAVVRGESQQHGHALPA